MPVDLDSSATFEDLILRTAVRIGAAEQTGAEAAIPTDPEVLRRVKEVVNEGYDRFLRANKNWTFLECDYELTFDHTGAGPFNIDADAGRYRLPGFVASPPITPWRYADTRTRRRNIQVLHPSIIDNYRQQRIVNSGPPGFCGCRDRESKAPIGSRPRAWECIFWPTPDQDYVVRATFKVFKHKMVDLAERHIAGGVHDATIIAWAAVVWYEDDAGDADSMAILGNHKRALFGNPEVPGERGRLAESIDIDLTNGPDSVGDVVDPSVLRNRYPGRDIAYQPRVATHNGVQIQYD